MFDIISTNLDSVQQKNADKLNAIKKQGWSRSTRPFNQKKADQLRQQLAGKIVTFSTLQWGSIVYLTERIVRVCIGRGWITQIAPEIHELQKYLTDNLDKLTTHNADILFPAEYVRLLYYAFFMFNNPDLTKYVDPDLEEFTKTVAPRLLITVLERCPDVDRRIGDTTLAFLAEMMNTPEEQTSSEFFLQMVERLRNLLASNEYRSFKVC